MQTSFLRPVSKAIAFAILFVASSASAQDRFVLSLDGEFGGAFVRTITRVESYEDLELSGTHRGNVTSTLGGAVRLSFGRSVRPRLAASTMFRVGFQSGHEHPYGSTPEEEFVTLSVGPRIDVLPPAHARGFYASFFGGLSWIVAYARWGVATGVDVGYALPVRGRLTMGLGVGVLFQVVRERSEGDHSLHVDRTHMTSSGLVLRVMRRPDASSRSPRSSVVSTSP